VEEHCPQQWLLEREDIVIVAFVAKALSQVSQVKQASKLILLASKTIHNDNCQIIQILCDAKWRG